MREPSLGGALLLVAVQGVLLQFGCSGSGATARTASGAIQRNTEIVHEECDTGDSGAAKLDANGDGKPDVIIVRSGNRDVCRALDLNFDGQIDSWIYYEENGQVRRRESDYDRDGRIDEILVYRGGAVAEKHRATMLTGKLDTWEFYKSGVLARTERDSNGDSVIDQWWEYPRPGCPVIHADMNSDGRPDPGASVDYCKETGYVPPERQEPRKPDSPTFEQSGALPTEVDSREEKPAGGATQGAPADAGGATSPGGATNQTAPATGTPPTNQAAPSKQTPAKEGQP